MAEFSGFPITVENLPQTMREEFPLGMTEDDFNVRLEAGGELILDGNEMRLGEPNFAFNSSSFLALDTLELKNGARIVTGGNIVTIIVNKLKSQEGSIIAFLDDEKVAVDGTAGTVSGSPGASGNPGDGGGAVSIHIIQALEGHVKVDLSGQNGGVGGAGAQGAQGVPGARGVDASDGFLSCERSGQDGHPGGVGLPGGPGGNGGVGGAGGILQLFNIGTVPLSDASITFDSKGGTGGDGGPGGLGGPGGPGGEGGHGSAFCGGGNGGPAGPDGPSGPSGVLSASGADGTLVKKNLNLVAVIQSGVKASNN